MDGLLTDGSLAGRSSGLVTSLPGAAPCPLGKPSQVGAQARTQNRRCAGAVQLRDQAKTGCMNGLAAESSRTLLTHRIQSASKRLKHVHTLL